MIGVDMPIGPPESRPRACDSAARRLLPRDRKSSVFPPRDMLSGRATRLPPEPPLDARSFKMEIWY